jgi:hypothetical protein
MHDSQLIDIRREGRHPRQCPAASGPRLSKENELPVVLADVDGVHSSPELLLPAEAWSTRFEFTNSKNWFPRVTMKNIIELHLLAAVRLP